MASRARRAMTKPTGDRDPSCNEAEHARTRHQPLDVIDRDDDRPDGPAVGPWQAPRVDRESTDCLARFGPRERRLDRILSIGLRAGSICSSTGSKRSASETNGRSPQPPRAGNENTVTEVARVVDDLTQIVVLPIRVPSRMSAGTRREPLEDADACSLRKPTDHDRRAAVGPSRHGSFAPRPTAQAIRQPVPRTSRGLRGC